MLAELTQQVDNGYSVGEKRLGKVRRTLVKFLSGGQHHKESFFMKSAFGREDETYRQLEFKRGGKKYVLTVTSPSLEPENKSIHIVVSKKNGKREASIVIPTIGDFNYPFLEDTTESEFSRRIMLVEKDVIPLLRSAMKKQIPA